MLSSNKKLFGTGELNFFWDFIVEEDGNLNYKKEIKENSLWLDIAVSVTDKFQFILEAKKTQLKFESLSIDSSLKYICGCTQESQVKYQNFQTQLLEAINYNLPNEVEYIIDSSKSWRNTFFRPIALSKVAQYEVKVIHLVRDGRGFMWSTIKGSNRKMEKGLDPKIPLAPFRATLNWFLTNTGAHFFQLYSSSENYCRIRYEDFVEKPRVTLQTIGQFIGIDLKDQITLVEENQDIPLANQITGNRLRKEEKITLKLDSAWQSSLKWYHKVLFWLIDWPYALLYGYNK